MNISSKYIASVFATLFVTFATHSFSADFPAGTWSTVKHIDGTQIHQTYEATLNFDGVAGVRWIATITSRDPGGARLVENTGTEEYSRSLTKGNASKERTSYAGTIKITDVKIGGEKHNILRFTLIRKAEGDPMSGVNTRYYYLDREMRLWLLNQEEANKDDKTILQLISESKDNRSFLDFKAAF